MLSYQKIVEIASEIFENENIPKENLVLLYTIPEKMHRKLDEDLFYRINGDNQPFEYSDIIEVEIGGVRFRIEIEK